MLLLKKGYLMVLQVLLIYNPKSGFFIDWKSNEIQDFFNAVVDPLKNTAVTLFSFGMGNNAGLTKKLDQGCFDQVWVAGGDGTITRIAVLIAAYDLPMGILPCGTMNLLARDLGMSLNIKDAACQLLSARPIHADKGKVNLISFLNISNIGISTHFTRLREKFRHRSKWIRWPLLFWYMIRSIFIYPAMTVEFRVGAQIHRFKTRSVSVSANPLDRNSILFPTRKRLDQGKLGFYIARDRSLWSLPTLMVKLLIGNWSFDDDLTFFSASQAVIIPKHRRKLKVMVDGELFRLKKPLHFTLHPQAVRLLKPERPE